MKVFVQGLSTDGLHSLNSDIRRSDSTVHVLCHEAILWGHTHTALRCRSIPDHASASDDEDGLQRPKLPVHSNTDLLEAPFFSFLNPSKELDAKSRSLVPMESEQ